MRYLKTDTLKHYKTVSPKLFSTKYDEIASVYASCSQLEKGSCQCNNRQFWNL